MMERRRVAVKDKIVAIKNIFMNLEKTARKGAAKGSDPFAGHIQNIQFI